jgi:hypothetical protein
MPLPATAALAPTGRPLRFYTILSYAGFMNHSAKKVTVTPTLTVPEESPAYDLNMTFTANPAVATPAPAQQTAAKTNASAQGFGK